MFDQFVLNRFIRRCAQLFPYKNKLDNFICDTEKMHSIQHAPNDIARWGDTDNMDVEAAELAHKNWIKQQGGKTNQGPAVQKSMMIHTLRKEASALCCEAVQGASCIICIICIIYIIYINIIKCIIFCFVMYSTNRGRRSWI